MVVVSTFREKELKMEWNYKINLKIKLILFYDVFSKSIFKVILTCSCRTCPCGSWNRSRDGGGFYIQGIRIGNELNYKNSKVHVFTSFIQKWSYWPGVVEISVVLVETVVGMVVVSTLMEVELKRESNYEILILCLYIKIMNMNVNDMIIAVFTWLVVN